MKGRGTSLGAQIIVWLFYAQWAWGIGWTFYRHGTRDGCYALFIPPYAWYRGVAAIWEEPKWKEHWAISTQTLGFVLQMSAVDQSPAQELDMLKGRNMAKTWIATVPQGERQKLLATAKVFCSALNRVRVNALEDSFKGMREHSATIYFRTLDDPSVVALSIQFSHEPGWAAAWRRVGEELTTNQKVMQDTFAEAQERLMRSGVTEKEAGLRFEQEATNDRFRRAASTLNDVDVKTRRLLAELFGE